MNYDSNIFPILNLNELSSKYRLFEIVGLNNSLDEYDSNLQYLIRSLSYKLKNPVTVIERRSHPRLVVRDDQQALVQVPQEINLTRNTVILRPTEDVITLDFQNHNKATKDICLRFLNFDLQNHLHNFHELWQPSAGRPFYLKHMDVNGKTGIHDGFVGRVVETNGGGFGILIECTKKYVATQSLPMYLTRDTFGRLKGKHFVYHYGHQWYEIKVEELSDLSASEYKYPRGPNNVTLINDLRTQIRKPHPKELADLPNDASVVLYRDNSGNLRGAPAGLCYQVLDSDDTGMNNLRDHSILKPSKRRREIIGIRDRFLNKIRFANTILLTNGKSLQIAQEIFRVPDFEFGNGRLLSTCGTRGAQQTNIYNLGKARKSLLLDSSAGFYSTGSFDRQYFIWPRSIEDSMGRAFFEELKRTVERMFPSGGGYNPVIISYDDRARTNYIETGWEIINTVKRTSQGPGYGVVMIPSEQGNRKRKHDELAALIIRELQDQEIYVSIMHTDTIRDSFYLSRDQDQPQYKVKDAKAGKLRGYITNVAINKVLLTNNKWPFVLNTPLFADLTIGIDVKSHTAGFTSIDKLGKRIRTEWISTKQKERLSSELIYTKLKTLISKEATSSPTKFSNIVVHRDGRIFETERKGILNAIADLKRDKIIASNAEIAILEISKHTSATLRLFDLGVDNASGDNANNPSIGSYVIMNSQEAYLCSTGKEFPHDGTSNPLLVRYDYGSIEYERLLEDMYFLTTLAFTRPEDCSRYPLTIKITDRRLSDVASEYDSDALALLEQLNVENP